MPGCIERFILCIVNLFSHTLYMEFLYWLLPHCGDSVPSVLIFFRDSQIITALLLVESIVMKTLIAKSDERPFLWIQSVVTSATSNRVGEFLLIPTSSKIEDAADLVESVKKSSSDANIWAAFCKLVDRILFFVFLCLYLLMFIGLLPEGYLYAKFDSIDTDS